MLHSPPPLPRTFCMGISTSPVLSQSFAIDYSTDLVCFFTKGDQGRNLMVVTFSFSIARTTLQSRYDFIFIIFLILFFLNCLSIACKCLYIQSGHYLQRSLLKYVEQQGNVKFIKMRKLTNQCLSPLFVFYFFMY